MIDELLECHLSALPSCEVLERVRRLERIRRRLAAVDHHLLAEVQVRRMAGAYGRSSTADLLVDELRISPAEAKERVRQAGDLGSRKNLTGESLPPLLPLTSSAVRVGELSSAHVSVISDVLEAAPPTWSPQVLRSVEESLIGFARQEHPGALRRTAALLMARLDPDGAEPRDAAVYRRRELTLTRNRDGSGCLRGRLTAEATAVWDTVLDSLSAPLAAEDGCRDDRSAGQRRHDALAEAGQRLLRSGDLPAAGGVPVTILVRTTPADLASARGVALSARGDRLPLCDLLPAAGDGEIVSAAVGRDGEVLALGRSRRLASRAQRLALAARDGGCTFPGCDRPAAWTEVHHVVPWERGGATDVENMCLVCRFHHRELDRNGWQVAMRGGVAKWLPPPLVDPARTPRRNTAHHLPEITFGRASPDAA